MIKVYSWSHCAAIWTFYGSFNSESEIEEHIKTKGVNPKYFKYGVSDE